MLVLLRVYGEFSYDNRNVISLIERKSLSYGVTTRLARIAPDENLKYGKWEIPAGVSYSSLV